MKGMCAAERTNKTAEVGCLMGSVVKYQTDLRENKGKRLNSDTLLKERCRDDLVTTCADGGKQSEVGKEKSRSSDNGKEEGGRRREAKDDTFW